MRPGTLKLKVAAGLAFTVATLATAATPALGADRVLVLSTSVAGGEESIEASHAAARGFAVDVVDPGAWSALSADDFASYRTIVVGGSRCGSLSAIAPAVENAGVWGPVVDGNVLVAGTDPAWHAHQGGDLLTTAAVDFAAARPGRTGAYVALSCYYHAAGPGTPVPLLDGLSGQGDFSMRSPGCFNDAHLTAFHPALGGLADVNLSRWICSVYETFDAWPDDFVPLAIAPWADESYTAADGSTGPPYILVRGEGVVVLRHFTLAARTATGFVGRRGLVTATLKQYGSPVAGVPVRFRVIAGPQAGLTGEGVTRGHGAATFGYTGRSPGTDWIVASFVDPDGHTQRSHAVTQEWTATPAKRRPR